MATDPTEPVRTTLDVDACARCENNHPQLGFRRFIRPAFVGDIELTHWALCPNTGEPILFGRPAPVVLTDETSVESPI